MRRRLAPWAGLAAGIALVAVAAAGMHHHADRGEEFGDAPAVAASPAAANAPAPGGPSVASPRLPDAPRRGPPARPEAPHPGARTESPRPQSRPHGTAAPSIDTRSARLADLDRPHGPDSVAIERLGIDAPIDPVGVRPDGALDIPADTGRAGWFRQGTPPGRASGSSVLAAHVDGPEGPGVFYRLRDAEEGDTVTVVAADGDRIDYEVSALAHYGKDELPTADLFRASGRHRLVLITCGGAFDEDTRSYAENVVVIAEPSG